MLDDVDVDALDAADEADVLPVGSLAALEQAVSGEEVEYTVGLPGDGAETEVFFSDLSHGYVTINADYTT